jgi:hypothetical protein
MSKILKRFHTKKPHLVVFSQLQMYLLLLSAKPTQNLANTTVSGGSFALGGTHTQNGALEAALKREQQNMAEREVSHISHLLTPQDAPK